MVSIQFQITFILFDTKIPLLRFYAFKSELLYNTNANYNFARLHATHQYILLPQKPQNYVFDLKKWLVRTAITSTFIQNKNKLLPHHKMPYHSICATKSRTFPLSSKLHNLTPIQIGSGKNTLSKSTALKSFYVTYWR